MERKERKWIDEELGNEKIKGIEKMRDKKVVFKIKGECEREKLKEIVIVEKIEEMKMRDMNEGGIGKGDGIIKMNIEDLRKKEMEGNKKVIGVLKEGEKEECEGLSIKRGRGEVDGELMVVGIKVEEKDIDFKKVGIIESREELGEKIGDLRWLSIGEGEIKIERVEMSERSEKDRRGISKDKDELIKMLMDGDEDDRRCKIGIDKVKLRSEKMRIGRGKGRIVEIESWKRGIEKRRDMKILMKKMLGELRVEDRMMVMRIGMWELKMRILKIRMIRRRIDIEKEIEWIEMSEIKEIEVKKNKEEEGEKMEIYIWDDKWGILIGKRKVMRIDIKEEKMRRRWSGEKRRMWKGGMRRKKNKRGKWRKKKDGKVKSNGGN